MALSSVKPENILKRADELVLVGQPATALQVLHDWLGSRRSRVFQQASLEAIMLKYISLAVDMRKGRMIREAFMNYRNMCQHVNIHSLEVVMDRFTSLAEEKVNEAKSKTTETNVDQIADLDENEPPESIFMKTISDKDRDRDAVTPWLRFLWEVYRVSLDTLKNNTRLEKQYQATAQHAIDFCLKYSRKAEFKRLSELLRSHLSSITRFLPPGSVTSTNAILLSNQDSLMIQLEIRFLQLSVSVQLELWQEAFRSVEDVHSLLVLLKRSIHPSFMVTYYECLVKIFRVGGNSLFHAASCNKLLSFLFNQSSKTISESELVKMICSSLLAALSCPLLPLNKSINPLFITPDMISEEPPEDSKESYLSTLLGLSRIPTRSSLIQDAIQRSYWEMIPTHIRDLYNLLENDRSSDWKMLCQTFSKLVHPLLSNTDLAFFVSLLRRVILSRLFERLTNSVTFITFDKLVQISNGLFSSVWDIEMFLLRDLDMVNVRMDHENACIKFMNACPFDSTINDTEDYHITPMALTSLVRQFSTLVDNNTPIAIKTIDKYDTIKMMIEQERSMLMERKELIEKRKEQAELAISKREKEEELERIERITKEQEIERIKRIEEGKKREQERLKKEREEIQREEKKRIAEEVNRKLSFVGKKINIEDLLVLDRNEIIRQQAKQLEEGKKEVEKKLQTMTKKMDHLERALRLEEKSLLEEDYSKQKIKDEQIYEQIVAHRIETSKFKRNQQIHLIQRTRVISSDLHLFVNQWKENKISDYESIKPELEREFVKEKNIRREMILEERYQNALLKEQVEKKQESKVAYIPKHKQQQTDGTWRKQ